MDDAVILNTSEAAAKFVTSVSGWVDRHGRFWGDDERMARWSGCTHIVCECGASSPKGYTKCDACRTAATIKRYEASPRKQWEDEPLYSDVADEYFFSADELYDYCDEHECQPSDLRLVICEPQYATQIDPADHYSDLLPEDGDVPDVLARAFDELNATIRAYKTPLSWCPGKVAAIVAPETTEAQEPPCSPNY